MTRIKLETVSPLPALKVWHFLASANTIADLKHDVCKTILPSCLPSNISLALDGFLLLEPSPAAVLRDGDLVTIQHQNPSAHVIAQTSVVQQRVARGTKIALLSDSSSEDDSDGPPPKTNSARKRKAPTSSEDESSADTSDEDSSSSDPSSDSSSSASSISAPLEVSSKPPIQYVPPGQGKLATQRRNLRRRKKRHYDRVASETIVDSSNPNDIPVAGPSEPRKPKIQTTTPKIGDSVSAPIMMASLSNKNKRRGFKQAMMSARPAKIVFDQPVASEAQELPFQSAADVSIVASTSFARLVPPSEKQAAGLLPFNVFVTAVDVEDADRHNTQQEEYEYVNTGHMDDASEDQIVLPYDDVPQAHSTVRSSEVQRKWDSLQLLADAGKLEVGSVVTWKALGIDPTTCTPEMCLYVGRVLECTTDKVLIAKLQDDTAGVVHALGGDTVVQEEEEYPWSVLLQEGWRVVS